MGKARENREGSYTLDETRRTQWPMLIGTKTYGKCLQRASRIFLMENRTSQSDVSDSSHQSEKERRRPLHSWHVPPYRIAKLY